ncbi:MAG: CDP-diacylglycerol--serine O-phosphatidyltransferase, partial [Elusimicrobiota bacterium]|nr:CDP-diacylglycerol--serine O-phosphatidyltransferase [Elusimicrobiota bacterium]
MEFGIYLPAIFTIANLGAGLYSILSSLQGKFTQSAWLILLAIVLDGIDGIIARTMKKTSLIGIELDSFADFVSFCIAPAILMYYLYLKRFGVGGISVGFAYIVFGAIRLARYNIKSFESKTYITYLDGLPTPAAGGILASFVLMLELFQKFEQGITAKTIPIVMRQVPFLFKLLPVLVVVLGILMITKFRYASFSRLKLTKRISVRLFILIFVTIILAISYPENIIFILFILY